MKATFLKSIFNCDIDTFTCVNWFMQVFEDSQSGNDFISKLYIEKLLPDGMPDNLEIQILNDSVDLVEKINNNKENAIIRVKTKCES